MNRRLLGVAAVAAALALGSQPLVGRADESSAPSPSPTAAAAMAAVPASGALAPPLALLDADGVKHALRDLRGRKNLVLVFFRGTW